MGLTEDLERKINYAAKYYGLDWMRVPAGILVSNGVEYWVIKLKKEKVRRLLHQNHGRSGKVISLPCSEQEVNAEVTQKYFHKQSWEESDLKKTCCYICNHGSKRAKLIARQRAVLAALA